MLLAGGSLWRWDQAEAAAERIARMHSRVWPQRQEDGIYYVHTDDRDRLYRWGESDGKDVRVSEASCRDFTVCGEALYHINFEGRMWEQGFGEGAEQVVPLPLSLSGMGRRLRYLAQTATACMRAIKENDVFSALGMGAGRQGLHKPVWSASW